MFKECIINVICTFEKFGTNLVLLSLSHPLLSSPVAVDYSLHWHSLQLIAISHSALWCWPDLKILFVNGPYLWSVGCLAGLEADKPSNSHLPLKRARGGVRFTLFKGLLSSFIILWADVGEPTEKIKEVIQSVTVKSSCTVQNCIPKNFTSVNDYQMV